MSIINRSKQQIQETDKCRADLVSHTERAYRNLLQETLDEITQLNFALAMSAQIIAAGDKDRRDLTTQVAELERHAASLRKYAQLYLTSLISDGIDYEMQSEIRNAIHP